MPKTRLSKPEFVSMLALLTATVAFSIDAMLPALPQIATDLTPQDVNRAQLVVITFVLGLGLGTFGAGPVSDALGRRRTIIGGMALYIAGAMLAAIAPTLEVLLLARLIQGLGAAGPRVASVAMIRDLYAGRAMAQIASFVMTLFALVPAVAPSMGALIVAGAGWRGIFLAFIAFGLIGGTWLGLRQPETLPPERRIPLRPHTFVAGTKEVLSNRHVTMYILVMAFGLGAMFAILTSTQQVYDQIFGKATSFPLWFGLSALLAAFGAIINAKLVIRFGMWRISVVAYLVQVVLSGGYLLAAATGIIPGFLAFPVFFVWTVSFFFLNSMTFGNLNALAMQPLGHIAGVGASIVGGISTILSVLVAAPIGAAFNGTIVPLLTGAFVCASIAVAIMWQARMDEAPQLAE
ncbi:multidrug effflux MFS transporter [Actibacterium sp. D379-3]